MNLLYILPKNVLSRWAGHLMDVAWPGPLGPWMVKAFASLYKIDLGAAEHPIEAYPSIGKFFIRKLKPGLRPQGQGIVTHPADSRISQTAIIEQGQLIQAKGKTYSVQEFLKNSAALSQYGGGFFTTYYLCPTDYHRVHSPVDGEILSATIVPGFLWPVNEWSVNRIDQLFSVNERVIIEIKTAKGLISVVLVGATNVGKISLSFESKILSNQSSNGQEPRKISYSQPISVKKGDELGIFHMGSTVILVGSQALLQDLKKPWAEVANNFVGKSVKVGEVLF